MQSARIGNSYSEAENHVKSGLTLAVKLKRNCLGKIKRKKKLRKESSHEV